VELFLHQPVRLLFVVFAQENGGHFGEFVLDPGRRSQYSDWAVGWTAE